MRNILDIMLMDVWIKNKYGYKKKVTDIYDTV